MPSSIPASVAEPDAAAIVAGAAAAPATMAAASGSATDAGIEDGMEEIHHEVHGDEDGGEKEGGPGDDGEIALLYRLEEQPADAGQDEDLLGQHEATDEHADLHPGDVEDGDEGIGEHVPIQ